MTEFPKPVVEFDDLDNINWEFWESRFGLLDFELSLETNWSIDRDSSSLKGFQYSLF